MPDPALLTDEEFSSLLDDLLAFVRIPSQSATSGKERDVRSAAEWLAARMEAVGIDNIRILDTKKHPTVYGEWLPNADAPTILVYGHYDVQPPEPLDLWDSPAFEPEIREGHVYGRGAADDKCGLICALHAIKAMRAKGIRPTVNLKFCFEGEEEIGSENLPALLETEKERFSADLALSVDGGNWDEKRPQLLLGLRGTICGEIEVTGPSHDLHSGLFGGCVLNPLEALCRLLASMRDPSGRIAIDGFYDDVIEFDSEAREAINSIPETTELLRKDSGVSNLHGESGYTPIEQTWIRPSLEINGITGGHQGSGPKTVIPSRAIAKLTCRLAPDQDPARILSLISRHLETHTPRGVTATFLPQSVEAKPYSLSRHHPAVSILRSVLTEVYGLEPYETRVGGSVPIFVPFKEVLGIETISVGCATSDSNLHAPNENVSVDLLRKCSNALICLLQRLHEAL